jgi:hypothetical protein
MCILVALKNIKKLNNNMHLEIFFFYNMHLDFATCQHVIQSFQNKASRNFKRSHRDILKDLTREFQNMSLTIDIPKYSLERDLRGV